MGQYQVRQYSPTLVITWVTSIFILAAFASTSSVQALRSEEHPRIVPPHPVRFGDRSLESTIRTDERYGHDGLFQGPRGGVYWNYLENPKPIQNPNLWPDMRSTYFIGRLAMPVGSSMTLRGIFPDARFFQFALYKWEHDTMGVPREGPRRRPRHEAHAREADSIGPG